MLISRFFLPVLVVGVLFGMLSCSERADSEAPKGSALFRLLPSSETGLDFSNNLPVGLDLNIFNYMYYYNGGGLAAADFNQDGLVDLLFTSNLGREKMYLNRGGLRFEDVSEAVGVDGGDGGWTTGASVADLNGDGIPDIYLCQVGKYRELDSRNMLFLSTGLSEDGIPAYREAASESGLDFQGFSTQAGFFDYDRDGDLDCYLMNHSLHHNGTFGRRETFINKFDSVSGDRLYRNDDGYFVDVSREAGIMSSTIGYGLGLAFGDVNLDGWPDIYVGNDFHENDYLYINQQDGTFREEITDQIQHTSRFSMGVDIADINGDAFPEIISLDMLPEDPEILKRSEGEDALDIFNFKLGYGYNYQFARNCLQLNNGNGTFSEIGMYAGVYATDWSWSPLFFDMNLDGEQDLFISNGIPKRMNDIDYIDFMTGNDLQFKIQFDQLEEEDIRAIEMIPEIKLENKFYLGTDGLRFEDAAGLIAGGAVSYSNSAIVADLDGDGDQEVVANNIDEQAFLYDNLTLETGVSSPKSLSLTLSGRHGNSNAIGAKVLCYRQGKFRMLENYQVRGFQSSMLVPLQFALPEGPADSLLVIWSDGTYKAVSPADEYSLKISWEQGLPTFDYSRLQPSAGFLIQSYEEEMGVNLVHEENPFVEFNREVLIPHAVSSEGPALAVGDLNGDGLDDFFVGSAKRKRAHLFRQTTEGTFAEVQSELFRADSTYEEVDAKIIDVTGDGYPDLVIATGGNEFRLSSEFTRPLLYVNDGTGLLHKKEDAFEGIHLTASTLEVWDFTGDGHPDIFFGARATPWAYGEPPRSKFLLNDGAGTFRESVRFGTEFADLGFVRDSRLADLDQDGFQDLILSTEWGGVKALMGRADDFNLREITDRKGWFSCVLTLDANADGELDVLVGNQGQNHRFAVSESEPLRMYFSDFDGNGRREQVLTYYLNGKEIPFHNKKELEKQMPFVKKEYVKASDFARAEIDEIFPASKLVDPMEAEDFTSALFVGQRGRFKPVNLPEAVQLSPVRAAVSRDFDKDGLPDLLLMGNFHDANIQMGRYDASYGSLLLNDGDGTFRISALQGEPIKGQVRNMEWITIGGEEYLLVARNSEKLKIVKITNQQSSK